MSRGGVLLYTALYSANNKDNDNDDNKVTATFLLYYFSVHLKVAMQTRKLAGNPKQTVLCRGGCALLFCLVFQHFFAVQYCVCVCVLWCLFSMCKSIQKVYFHDLELSVVR